MYFQKFGIRAAESFEALIVTTSKLHCHYLCILLLDNKDWQTVLIYLISAKEIQLVVPSCSIVVVEVSLCGAGK